MTQSSLPLKPPLKTVLPVSRQIDLDGWGRISARNCRQFQPRTPQEAKSIQSACHPLVARGAGRGYGDCAIQPNAVVSSKNLRLFTDFDPQSGLLTAQAGVTLEEVIRDLGPRGWFPYVVPGTRYITLGGAVAADVHGKNHHLEGGFGAYVQSLDILCADGQVRHASRSKNERLFRMTIGGMGLTGIILSVTMRLRPIESGWIRQRTIPCPDLDSVMQAFEDHASTTYSVAWIDCLARGATLGRSLLMLGEHLPKLHCGNTDLFPKESRHKPMPMEAPSFALNRYSVSAFNKLYYATGKNVNGPVSWEKFFFPLDAIDGWNRIYGKRGFMQFQSVIPDGPHARQALVRMLEETASAGKASFLAVLKRFGAEGLGAMSFPRRGWTLAMDFPADEASFKLMRKLDRITLDYGGRFYLAKDARLDRATFDASEPRATAFRAYREETGAAQIYRSSQSERLAL